MRIDDSKRLAQMGMNASHNKDVLLIAILHETDDLSSRNHWTLRDKLSRLRALAVMLRDTGRIEHDPGVVGIILEDEHDYGRANEHLPKEED